MPLLTRSSEVQSFWTLLNIRRTCRLLSAYERAVKVLFKQINLYATAGHYEWMRGFLLPGLPMIKEDVSRERALKRITPFIETVRFLPSPYGAQVSAADLSRLLHNDFQRFFRPYEEVVRTMARPLRQNRPYNYDGKCPKESITTPECVTLRSCALRDEALVKGGKLQDNWVALLRMLPNAKNFEVRPWMRNHPLYGEHLWGSIQFAEAEAILRRSSEGCHKQLFGAMVEVWTETRSQLDSLTIDLAIAVPYDGWDLILWRNLDLGPVQRL
jgi:hypothetical protein